MSKARLGLVLVLSIALGGCFIAPLKVANELEITVVDADTDKPIPHAQVVHLACDLHDFNCRHGRLVTTTSNEKGEVSIESKRKWGFWIVAPGGLPVPDHLIAVWAPGYSAFVFSQYEDDVATRKQRIHRPEIKDALKTIPSNQSSSDGILNPKEELIGGKIRLLKIKEPQ